MRLLSLGFAKHVRLKLKAKVPLRQIAEEQSLSVDEIRFYAGLKPVARVFDKFFERRRQISKVCKPYQLLDFLIIRSAHASHKSVSVLAKEIGFSYSNVDNRKAFMLRHHASPISMIGNKVRVSLLGVALLERWKKKLPNVDLFMKDRQVFLTRVRAAHLDSLDEFEILSLLIHGPRFVEQLVSITGLAKTTLATRLAHMSSNGLIYAGEAGGHRRLVSMLPGGEAAWDRWRRAENLKHIFLPKLSLLTTPEGRESFDKVPPTPLEMYQAIRLASSATQIVYATTLIFNKGRNDILREPVTCKRVSIEKLKWYIEKGYDIHVYSRRMRKGKIVVTDSTTYYLMLCSGHISGYITTHA